MRGRLEREIRLLPQVLACSVDDDVVVVLLHLHADRAATERAIARVLGRQPTQPRVVLLGGTEPQPAPLRTPRRVPAVIGLAAVAGTAALGLSSLVGGLQLDRGPRAVTEASAPVFDEPFLDVLPPRVGAGAAPEGPDVAAAGSAGGIGRPRARPAAAIGATGVEATLGDTSPSTPAPGADPACPGPPRRGAPRSPQGRHTGAGPARWSRSVLVDPQDPCAHGRT